MRGAVALPRRKEKAASWPPRLGQSGVPQRADQLNPARSWRCCWRDGGGHITGVRVSHRWRVRGGLVLTVTASAGWLGELRLFLQGAPVERWVPCVRLRQPHGAPALGCLALTQSISALQQAESALFFAPKLTDSHHRTTFSIGYHSASPMAPPRSSSFDLKDYSQIDVLGYFSPPA